MASNNWTREELIVSLDLYLRRGREATNPDDQEVRRLSMLLRRLGEAVHGEIPDDYRTPASIALRASNWRSLHDDYTWGGKKGLANVGSLAVEVWDDFHDRQELLSQTARGLLTRFSAYNIREVAASIFEKKEIVIPEGAEEALEGRMLSKEHFSRERDRTLVARKKAAVRNAGGRLACEACGLVLSDLYGPHGEGFIEVHHTVPLSSLPGQRSTALSDLALVCANCHRMIHHRRPWLSIAELRERIESNAKPLGYAFNRPAF